MTESQAAEAGVAGGERSVADSDNQAADGTFAHGDEARAEVDKILHGGKTGIPSELIAELVFARHADGGYAVLRAAAEAAQRRMQIAAEQGLRVRERPEVGLLGDYRTGRPRVAARPYTTRLYGLDPLEASCDCPDFRGSSLGFCKHVLAVLADLAKRKRVFARARSAPAPRLGRPELRWSPFKPLAGDGDWMMQIELHWPDGGRKPGARWQTLKREFATGGRGQAQQRPQRLRLRTAHADQIDRRAALLAKLRPLADDPALRALIDDERERMATAKKLKPLAKPAARPMGFGRKLYPYQREGVARFLATGRLLLADDMGLGKTTQAIAACHMLFHQGLVKRGLLVVPAPLKQQWLREWHACSDAPIEVVEGTPDLRAEAYRRTKRGFLVVNYEQVLRDLDETRAWNADLVLLDEAQRIKNWETKTAATIKQLQVPFRLVLTGTPFENRLAELDSILEWIDRRPLQPTWRLSPFHDIGAGSGLQHLDVLRARLAPVLIRRRRQEVLSQLPGRTDTRIDVPMTEPQREEHDLRIADIAKLTSAAEKRPLTQPEFLRLMALFTEQRVIANGMAQFSFEEVWPGIEKARPTRALLDGLAMPKLTELQSLLHELVVEQERKVVVFSAWRRALRLADWAVAESLRKHGVRSAFFTGAESLRRRNENVIAFHDDPTTRILFATDAGGVGLNLQRAASCCVHMDLPWNPAVFEQRVGRVWRLGQTEKVDVYSLVSEPSIEDRMATVLQHKQAAFSAVFDGTSDEVRFDQQGGFLGAARKLAVAADLPAGDDAAGDADATDAAVVDRIETSPEAARTPPEEIKRVTKSEDLPPQPVEPASGSTASLEAGQVRSLLAGLTVQPRADGGMVLEADRESAAVLADVLRGLASAIEGAAGSR